MANILSYPGIGVVAVSPDSFKIPERLAIIVVPFIRSWFRIGHKIITPTSISTSPNVETIKSHQDPQHSIKVCKRVSSQIQRTFQRLRVADDAMRVDHRRADVAVPEHLLYLPDVEVRLQKMCRKRMTQGVW